MSVDELFDVEVGDEEELLSKLKKLKKLNELMKERLRYEVLKRKLQPKSAEAVNVKARSSDDTEDVMEFYRKLLREAQALKLFGKMLDKIERSDEGEEKKAETVGVSTQPVQQNPIASLIASMVAQGMDAEKVNEFVSKLKPEVIATLQAMNQNNPILTAMIFSTLMRREQPQQVSIQDIAQLMIAMNQAQSSQTAEMMKVIAELIKAQRGGGSETNAQLLTTLMQAILEMSKTSSQQLAQMQAEVLRKEIEDLKERIQYTDPKQLMEQFRQEAEFWKGILGTKSDPRIPLLLKKMEIDQQRWQWEQQFRFEQERLKNEREEKKMQMLINGLVRPIVEKTAPLMDDIVSEMKRKIREEGMRKPASQATAVQSMGAVEQLQSQVVKPKPVPVKVTCPDCGNVFEVEPDEKGEYPAEVKCPKCGAVLTREVPGG